MNNYIINNYPDLRNFKDIVQEMVDKFMDERGLLRSDDLNKFCGFIENLELEDLK